MPYSKTENRYRSATLITSFAITVNGDMPHVRKGDLAIGILSKQMDIIFKQRKPIEGKIHAITEELAKEMLPWVRKGDDRVLSKMRIIAGSAVERIVKAEVVAVSKSGQLSVGEKLAAMEKLETQVKGLSWLPEGLKSSIMVDMAFARADIRSQTP